MDKVHATEGLLAAVLVQLVIIVGAARLMHGAFRRMGQPGVVGEIVAGLMLGPSLLGAMAPEWSTALFRSARPEPLTILSQIGLVLLMFEIGCGFEFTHLAAGRARRAAGRIAVASVGVPLLLGIGFGRVSHAALAPGIDVTVYSLFTGVALAITALPILGRILKGFGLQDAEIGAVAIAAAAVNDVVGWLLLTGIAALAASAFSAGAFALRLAMLAALLAFARFALVPLAGRWLRRWPPGGEGGLAPELMALVLCLTFALAVATSALGIFAIFGGFLSGLVFFRHRAFVAAWEERVGGFARVFLLPVFFTFTGLRTDLRGLGAGDLGWLALALALAIGGKVLPVYLAARSARYDRAEAWTLGALMNTRALMELVVLNVGLELGALPPKVFTMLVVMAVVTTLMTGPWLRVLLPRAGYRVPAGANA